MLENILLLLFLISMVLQLGYLAAINLGLSKSTAVKPPSEYLPLSVLICAKNELNNLKKLIPAILGQSHRQFEIIVVNDRSSDGSFEYLEKQKKEIDLLKVVHIDRTPEHIDPKKYAITLGVKAATQETLVLTDADCLPASEHWLREMQRSTVDHEIVLGYSGYSKEKGFLNYFIRFETLWTGMQYLSFGALGWPYMGVGRNLSYRKSLFLKAKGFNGYQEVTGGDDDLMVQKLANHSNTAVMVGECSKTISVPKSNLGEYIKQKLRHLSVGKYYSFKSKMGLSVWTISHSLVWVLFIWLAILRIEPYLIAGSFLIRTLLFYFTFNRSSRILGEKLELWGLIALDCIFVLYHSTVGIIALCTKRVKWI